MNYNPYWYDRTPFPPSPSQPSLPISVPPSFPSPMGQGGQPAQSSPPLGPPPAYIPHKPQVGTFAVDPSSIRRCLFHYTYVWRRDGRGFWFYPVNVGRHSVAGYRWSRRRHRWVYIGMDLNRIAFFTCS